MTPALRWTVSGSPRTLKELFAASAADTALALADGRVFVDGRRASDENVLLEPGARVELYAARAPAAALRLLGRVGGLVAVDKPVGMATEPDHAGIGSSVVALAADLLHVDRRSIHALSRLDVGVSGVVLLALDEVAQKLVITLREQGRLRRRYVAIAAGRPSPASGAWAGAIGRARGARRAVGGSDARAAETRYVVVATRSDQSLLALEPITGRTHQLRVHAANAGAPLLGDRTYGGPRRLTQPDGSVRALDRIALHAAWVELPLDGGVRLEAELPPALSELWTALGGAPADLEHALADSPATPP